MYYSFHLFYCHRRELYVVGRSAGFSSKAAAGAAVSQRAAAGRNAAALAMPLWASNARQDTTFDTLQKEVIPIYVHIIMSLLFLKLNGFSINAVLRLSIIVRYPHK